jgi:hypothetical protein
LIARWDGRRLPRKRRNAARHFDQSQRITATSKPEAAPIAIHVAISPKLMLYIIPKMGDDGRRLATIKKNKKSLSKPIASV